MTAVGEKARLLVADVALAVREKPVAGDRDLAQQDLRLGDRFRLGELGEGFERTSGAVPVGRPRAGEVETVAQLRRERIRLQHAEIVLADGDSDGFLALAANGLGADLERLVVVTAAAGAVAAVLEEVVDHVHEAVSEAEAEAAGAAHDEAGNPGHRRAKAVVVAGVHHRLVPDGGQAVALEVGVVALKWHSRRGARTGHRPVVAGHDPRHRGQPSNGLRQQRLHEAQLAELLYHHVVEPVEMRCDQLLQFGGWHPGAQRLDQVFLHVLLRLGESEVGHELDREQGVGDGPGIRPVADQRQLQRPPLAGEVEVHPLRIRLGQEPRIGAEPAHLLLGLPPQTHPAHEHVDGEGVVVTHQVLAQPPPTGQPHHHHLHHAVMGMCKPETPGETEVVVRPQPHDAI